MGLRDARLWRSSLNTMIAAVDTDLTIEDFLPQLEEALGMSGGTHDPEDVVARIQDGRAQLWVQNEGLVITEVEQYPNGPVLNFWLAAGEKDDILSLLPRIYGWGRHIGCERATMLGRKGWERVLADDGWERSQLVHFTRDLTDG